VAYKIARMVPFLSLFHCDTPGGNRVYEDRFQWFLFSGDRENRIRNLERPELERLVVAARNEPSDHAAALSLARILGTSLEHGAYKLFIEDIRLVVAVAIFFDESIGEGASVDFERTKEAHYRKYCLFKFASFLDTLCPGSVHWRGQAELESDRLVCIGLDRFQRADLQGRALMLSRWMQNPGFSAFSEKKAKHSRRMLARHVFLLKLPASLAAGIVAARLDEAGLKPGRKFSSYAEWYRRNRKSFESWLSRERSESKRVWIPAGSQRSKSKSS
jgi:hypothetical protein